MKARSGLKSIRIKGEAASADETAAKKYPEELAKICQDGGYCDDLVFNCDETGLLIKPMVTRSFTFEGQKSFSGYKENKERLTFLFGGNASGTLKLKPLVLGRSKNPRCFKRVNRFGLPVIYDSNKKAWMTKEIFKNWFENHFAREVAAFCHQKGLPFKALLLLDNAPGHPKDLHHPNIEIRYLPPNTTSLLQPMDMGVISTFKALYLKETFTQALLAVDPSNPRRVDLPQFWKQFDVLNAIESAWKCWNSISEYNMKSMWKNLFPKRDLNEAETQTNDQITEEIVKLGQELEFTDLTETVVKDMIGPMAAALTDQDLIEIDNENEKGDGNDDDENDEEKEPKIHLKKIMEGLDFMEKAMQIFAEYDPDVGRRLEVKSNIENSMKPYEELVAASQFSEKKQSKIDAYFTPK